MASTERTGHMTFGIISVVGINVGMCANFFSDEYLSHGRQYTKRSIQMCINVAK